MEELFLFCLHHAIYEKNRRRDGREGEREIGTKRLGFDLCFGVIATHILSTTQSNRVVTQSAHSVRELNNARLFVCITVCIAMTRSTSFNVI